jgi:hypothetical protein
VLELRGSSLWTHAICETPLDHWTVAMEAFAVAMDDPFDAWRGERGDRIGLAFDLEWENEPNAAVWSVTDARYEVPCQVNGELLLGAQKWTVATTGTRSHSWGEVAAETIDAETIDAEMIDEKTISFVDGRVAPYLLPGPLGLRRIVRRGAPGAYPAAVVG